MGFQDAPLTEDYFDLAISNIPFGDYPVLDNRVDAKFTRAIHDYFFARTLQVVRPGGIIAFITSRYTLDKMDDSLRCMMAGKADLLAAVRLPRETFSRNAGTQVVTDVIILQKREAETEDCPKFDWLYTAVYPVEGGEARFNRFFQNNPQYVIGTPKLARGMYSTDEYTVSFDGAVDEIAERLRAALMEQLPENGIAFDDALDFSLALLPSGKKQHVISASPRMSAEKRRKVDGLRAIYDKAKELLRAEINDAPAVKVAVLRGQLNEVYDAFVRRYGSLTPAVRALLKDNPAAPFLLSLENDYSPASNTADKADIFTATTIRPRSVGKVETLEDALTVSLNERGRIDPAYMARLLNDSEDALADALLEKRLAFRSPDGGFELADLYLSGDIYEKIRRAKLAEELNPGQFQRNIAALEQALPEPLKPGEIIVNLGAGWIPADVIHDFIAYILPGWEGDVVYIPEMGQWGVETTRNWVRHSALYSEWGTRRRNALTIIEKVLNGRDLTVWDETEDGKRVPNQKDTTAV